MTLLKDSMNATVTGQKIPYDELLELAAHDLQSPLRKLSVLTDRFLHKFSDPGSTEAKDYADRIKHCLAEMQAMVNGITELGHFKAGNLKPALLDLKTLIEHQLSSHLKTIQTNGGVLLVDATSKQYADPDCLSRVLALLLDNSIKFSDGSRKLQVRISTPDTTAADGERCGISNYSSFSKIIYSDNGIGFPAENAGKIFQPLVRLNGKSSYPGSGLGLTLCEVIVRAHDGYIFADADPASGCHFTIMLPKNQQH